MAIHGPSVVMGLSQAQQHMEPRRVLPFVVFSPLAH